MAKATKKGAVKKMQTNKKPESKPVVKKKVEPKKENITEEVKKESPVKEEVSVEKSDESIHAEENASEEQAEVGVEQKQPLPAEEQYFSDMAIQEIMLQKGVSREKAIEILKNPA